MDRFSGKRTVGGLCVPKKTSSLVLPDAADNRNGDGQFCNRLGCNGRLNYTKSAQIGSSKKSKSWRPSTPLSSGKETVGSSRTSSAVNNTKIKFPDSRRKLPSKLEAETSESSSSVQDETEIQELIVSPSTNSRVYQSELRKPEAGNVATAKVGPSTMLSKARQQNSFYKRPGMTNQVALLSSSSSSSSETASQKARGSVNASRHGVRSLRTTISDTFRPGCSVPESNSSKRKDIVKKKNPEGETSSSSGVKNETSRQPSDSEHISIHTNGFTIPDFRRNRNWPPGRENGATSVRSRRLTNINIRAVDPSQLNGNALPSAESPLVMPQVHHPERIISANGNVNALHREAFSSRSSSYGHPSGSNYVDHMTAMASADIGINRLLNIDGSRRYNMNGIAEVLLALERIEQDEELTYEQLLALETNLFIGGLSFYDQHRDMRLDIENMSYEELLALEEKMGNVSTALSEDALLKSVTVSTYQPTSTEEDEAASNIKEEDNKCSICQEEYMIGDEVGKIGCEHGYHMECIRQWLQMKNWCPICKASVEPPKAP